MISNLRKLYVIIPTLCLQPISLSSTHLYFLEIQNLSGVQVTHNASTFVFNLSLCLQPISTFYKSRIYLGFKLLKSHLQQLAV